ncbi:thy-1 membrane glycoprotein [Empidonax traillii]|uniref:thy-1 membrane glycoprotein n=1 Tax=Empidonax traillii TaxID=164674 RepID=UPI000FFD25BD|nr:thy-1 membrane glycoprotein [Empidonax traillii]
MNPTVGIAVILTVLQAAHCQMIKDLSACLLGQNLRVDCHYENKTSNPLTYEFSITKNNRKHVIQSTMNIPENIYRSRANVTMYKNLVCLHLQSFTTSDEGVYMCELKATNDYTGNQIRNITVIKGELGSGTCWSFSLSFPPSLGLGRASRENTTPKPSPIPIKVSQPFLPHPHRWAHSAPSHFASFGSHPGHITQVSFHREARKGHQAHGELSASIARTEELGWGPACLPPGATHSPRTVDASRRAL